MARKVKVGCGVVAAAYYLPYHRRLESAELVAVCDRSETRTRACARLFGATEQYRDYDEMIRRADIEAVLILTAPGTHVSFALAAVRQAAVKALIEPSSSTPLEPEVAMPRDLVRNGVLGPCRSVAASARISVGETDIVAEERFDEFLAGVTDPDRANHLGVVLDLPRTKRVAVEAVDNVYSLYEMASGGVGSCHAGRTFHPVLPATGDGSLRVFGTDGWFHIRPRGGLTKERSPQPVPGGFNHYHESTRHFVDCILEDREPVVNVDWGLHITVMMAGALESSATGRRYEMTSTLAY